MKLKRGVTHMALRAGCDLAVVHIRSSHRWLDKESQWYEIPLVCPTITLTYAGLMRTADYLKEGEVGFSLASRRLTRAMELELSSAAFDNHKIQQSTKT